MSLPSILLTGASGFLGRNVIVGLQQNYRIVALARRSQRKADVPDHPNVRWIQADIAERRQLDAALAPVLDETGRIDAVVHLAAYYDFTGADHPEYWRTNVTGLRNVLELTRACGIRRFLFASSLAACSFPPAGLCLTETSAADGDHVYARTKRIGEQMLGEYKDAFDTVSIRLAALYSDWCEYTPLYSLLRTWLSSAWNARVLSGTGRTAIPYLHVDDAVAFIRRALEHANELVSGEVLIASPDAASAHRELFEAATLAHYGTRMRPRFVPKWLCRPGIGVLNAAARVSGEAPFERPWMARYVDAEMRVDASLTRSRLNWAPRPRLGIVRRLPFLVENLKTDPHEWNRRNTANLKPMWLSDQLKIHWLLQQHEDEIVDAFSRHLLGPAGAARFPNYRRLDAEEHDWNHRVIFRQLLNAVRTGEHAVFARYCRDLAERRLMQGFEPGEFCGALELLNLVCLRTLRRQPEARDKRQQLLDYVTMTLRFGCDQAQEVAERGSVAVGS